MNLIPGVLRSQPKQTLVITWSKCHEEQRRKQDAYYRCRQHRRQQQVWQARVSIELILFRYRFFPGSYDVFSRLDSQSLLERNQSMPKAVKVPSNTSSNSVFSRLGLTSSSQTAGKRRVQASGTLQIGVKGSTRTVNAGQRKIAAREASVFDRLGT